MNRDELDALILQHLSGDLGPEEEKRLREHLAARPEDSSRIVELSDEELLLQEVARMPPRVTRSRRVFAARTRVPAFGLGLAAAAAVLGTILIVAILYGARTPARQEGAPVASPSRQTAPPPDAEPPPRPEPVPPPAPRPVPIPPAPVPVAPPSPAPPPPLPPRPEPATVPPPPPPPEVVKPPAPPVPDLRETVTDVATVGRCRGDVILVAGRERTPARKGEKVKAGQGLETSGPKSSAWVSFPDGTRVELGGDTAVQSFAERASKGGPGKRVVLSRGTLDAEVVKQPVDQPMVFATPQGEAKVQGTSLWLRVDQAEGTSLEVKEGKVRLTRLSDRKFVDVAGGYAATAGSGPLQVKPLPPNLLADGGFEEGGRKWFSGQLGSKDFVKDGRVVSSPVRRGARSLAIIGRGEHIIRQGIAVEPGMTYEVEGWLKAAEGAGDAGIALIWYPSSQSDSWIKVEELADGLDVREWTRCSGRFTAPPGATWAWVTLAFGGNLDTGRAWFDDVTLSKRP